MHTASNKALGSSSLRDTDRNKQHQNAKQLRRGKITPSYFSSFQSHKSPEKSCITPNESRGEGTGKSKSGKRLDCGTHKFTSCTIASVRNLRCLNIFGRLRLKCSWYEWFERVPRLFGILGAELPTPVILYIRVFFEDLYSSGV